MAELASLGEISVVVEASQSGEPSLPVLDCPVEYNSPSFTNSHTPHMSRHSLFALSLTHTILLTEISLASILDFSVKNILSCLCPICVLQSSAVAFDSTLVLVRELVLEHSRTQETQHSRIPCFCVLLWKMRILLAAPSEDCCWN